MRILLAFPLGFAAGAALATETPAPQAPRTETASRGNSDQIICRSVEEIGSRLSRRRVCRTRAEWADLQTQERQVVDRVQSFKPCQPYC